MINEILLPFLYIWIIPILVFWTIVFSIIFALDYWEYLDTRAPKNEKGSIHGFFKFIRKEMDLFMGSMMFFLVFAPILFPLLGSEYEIFFYLVLMFGGFVLLIGMQGLIP